MLKNIRLNTDVHDYYLYLNELFGGGGGYHFKQFLYFLNKKQKINFLYSEDILEEC